MYYILKMISTVRYAITNEVMTKHYKIKRGVWKIK